MTENSSKARRIRCKNCGYSVPNSLQICPTCGANLEAKPVAFARLGILILSLGVLYVGYLAYQQINEPIAQPVQSLTSTLGTETETATVTPALTDTPTLEPTATPTDTPTVTPTNTPSPTPTQTFTPTPEPTSTPAPPTNTPNAPTPKPTPTVRFDTLTIIGPENNVRFEKDTIVRLEWEPVGTLADDEWYAVRLTWVENGGQNFGGVDTRDTFWHVPQEQYYGRADRETNRAYTWRVFVEKAVRNSNSSQTAIPISLPSETRTFFWE